jgi:hypothetical protein
MIKVNLTVPSRSSEKPGEVARAFLLVNSTVPSRWRRWERVGGTSWPISGYRAARRPIFGAGPAGKMPARHLELHQMPHGFGTRARVLNTASHPHTEIRFSGAAHSSAAGRSAIAPSASTEGAGTRPRLCPPCAQPGRYLWFFMVSHRGRKPLSRAILSGSSCSQALHAGSFPLPPP